jgi:hypothetical protein
MKSVAMAAWLFGMSALAAHAETYRVALQEQIFTPVWQAVVTAIQQADPANQYVVIGVLPTRRLIAEGKAGHFDCFFPSGVNDAGNTLLGFEAVASFRFYETDLVLLNLRGSPPLNADGKPTGVIEAIPGTQPLLPFVVDSQNNHFDRSIKKLLAGRIVGVVAGRPQLEALVADQGVNPDTLAWTRLMSGSVRVGWVPQPGWQTRADHVDAILEKLRRDGTLAPILAPIFNRGADAAP